MLCIGLLYTMHTYANSLSGFSIELSLLSPLTKPYIQHILYLLLTLKNHLYLLIEKIWNS
jgi:hypothetical protein